MRSKVLTLARWQQRLSPRATSLLFASALRGCLEPQRNPNLSAFGPAWSLGTPPLPHQQLRNRHATAPSAPSPQCAPARPSSQQSTARTRFPLSHLHLR